LQPDEKETAFRNTLPTLVGLDSPLRSGFTKKVDYLSALERPAFVGTVIVGHLFFSFTNGLLRGGGLFADPWSSKVI
jgi:hypothetical protein